MGSCQHDGNQIGALEEGGDVEGEKENEEDADEAGDPSLDGRLEFPFSLHDEEDGAVHGEEGHDGDAKEKGVGIEKVDEVPDEVALGIKRDAACDVPHGNADQQRRKEAPGAEGDVPTLTPGAAGLLAAELDGDRPENQCRKQEHEGVVKSREDCRIGSGEGGKEGATSCHEPDFVAVPDRPDGVEQDAAILILLDEEVQDADAEVESVEDGVAREEDAYEKEPDDVEVGEVHGGDYSEARPFLVKSSPSESPTPLVW